MQSPRIGLIIGGGVLYKIEDQKSKKKKRKEKEKKKKNADPDFAIFWVGQKKGKQTFFRPYIHVDTEQVRCCCCCHNVSKAGIPIYFMFFLVIDFPSYSSVLIYNPAQPYVTHIPLWESE